MKTKMDIKQNVGEEVRRERLRNLFQTNFLFKHLSFQNFKICFVQKGKKWITTKIPLAGDHCHRLFIFNPIKI